MNLLLVPVGLGCDHLNSIEIDLNSPKTIMLGRNAITTHNSCGQAQNIGEYY